MTSIASRITCLLILVIAISTLSQESSPNKKSPDVPSWGNAYTTDENRAIVSKLLSLLSSNNKEAKDLFSRENISIGPLLWSRLIEADKELKGIGSPYVPKEGPGQRTSLNRTIPKAQYLALIKSPALSAMASTFAKGTMRPASQEERKYFCNLSLAIAIKNIPITSSQVETTSLIVVFQDGYLTWLELAPTPIPHAP